MPRATIIIPARYDSTRFPGKVLADRTGRPLIQHVHERACGAACAERVVVATDDERIRAAVAAFGGEVIMTRPDHPNGTSRVAEAAASLSAEFIVNVQGDEPELDPGSIDLCVDALAGADDCHVGTLAAPFAAGEDPADPNVVKVVLDTSGRALYFSRSLIPHAAQAADDGGGPLKHVGLYVYRRDFLPRYATLAPTPLERSERLEQLRVLEHGYRIRVAIGEASSRGIDTPGEYEAFVLRETRRASRRAEREP